MNVRANLKEINNKIKNCAKDSGREAHDITLIAVSKYHSVDEIMQVYNEGQRDFGENKVQDLIEKINVCPEDIRWHLIGHLQTNKVKYIIGKTHLIHSLDRLELAKEIDKRSKNAGIVTNCLVQVNSTGIEGRFGVEPENLINFLNDMKIYENIKILGIMGMAPKDEDSTRYFTDLKSLFDKACDLHIWQNGILSMGMSDDFENAILCGSTMVRIGRYIFKEENA